MGRDKYGLIEMKILEIIYIQYISFLRWVAMQTGFLMWVAVKKFEKRCSSPIRHKPKNLQQKINSQKVENDTHNSFSCTINPLLENDLCNCSLYCVFTPNINYMPHKRYVVNFLRSFNDNEANGCTVDINERQ